MGLVTCAFVIVCWAGFSVLGFGRLVFVIVLLGLRFGWGSSV